MFLCGNCTTVPEEPDIVVNHVGGGKSLNQFLAESVSGHSMQIMLRPSRYKYYLGECQRNGTQFTDPDFPPNQNSLNHRSDREVTWRRLSEIMEDYVLVDGGIVPADIQQGNVGDCYFLASLAALAEEPSRIEAIFHQNFERNKHGIYKVLINREGVPTEMLLDDYIPVYKSTNRPVFCKAHGNQVWVMLIEKAWAKMKGSYGDINSGSPHEVLNAFSIAPCYNFNVHEQLDQQDLEKTWKGLVHGAQHNFPMCAGTNDHVNLPGLKENHSYTLLHCQDVVSHNKKHKILRLRNPWGKTEYQGFASENDDDFWKDVPPEQKEKILPKKGKNDGEFTIPIQAFVENFETIDLSHVYPGYSYEFKTLWMQSNQAAFVHLTVNDDHDAYLCFEKGFKNEEGQKRVEYGYTRMLIAYEPVQGEYEFYGGKVQTLFPDMTYQTSFKRGKYFIMLQANDPMQGGSFSATFSYYHKASQEKALQDIEIQHKVSKNLEQLFLEQVFKNHAMRLNDDTTKLSPRKSDFVRSALLAEEGGYGYVFCTLQEESDVRVCMAINQEKLKESGFVVKGNYAMEDEVEVEAAQQQIIIFSIDFASEQGAQAGSLTFPPEGFKLSKKV